MFVDEGDRVVLRGELGADVVYNVAWDGTEEWEGTPGWRQFQQVFELDDNEYPVPSDEYCTPDLLRIITRKTDGTKFGYRFQGGDRETDAESNGEELGFVYEFDDDDEVVGGEAWVFLPVKPASIPTFEFA